MNGMYFILIFVVVMVGMFLKCVFVVVVKIGLIVGFMVIVVGYFVLFFDIVVELMNDFYFLGVMFVWFVLLMFFIGECKLMENEFW